MANSSQQIKEITAKLEQGVQDLFNSEKYTEYLKTMSRFHKYSLRNTLLIHIQMPGATYVTGYTSWNSKFGRHIKAGEKAMQIIAPVPFTKREEKEKLDPDTRQPIIGEDGMPVIEYTERRLAHYKVVNVFDVSQTDGKPLPTLVQDLTGNVEQYEAFVDALREVSPLPIVLEPLDEAQDGYCRFGEKIGIREGMSEIQTVSAIIHELTHAKLHDLEALRLMDENAQAKDRRTEEVEAESVSFSVCSHFNIETGANSFGYIAEWSRGRELKELNASLDTIRKAAAEMIDSIEDRFREIAKERDITFAVGEQQAESGEPITASVDRPRPGAVYAQYCNQIAETVGNDEIYINAIIDADEQTARAECEAAVNRAVLGLYAKSDEHFELFRQYTDNADFKGRLDDYVFMRAYLEPQTAQRDNAANETVVPDADASSLIAAYARNAEVSAPRRIGSTILMTPVFNGGNFNREGKKIRVEVEEPAGKYQLFSHEENGGKSLYFLTASGMIDRTAAYFRDEWNEETRKWENRRPSEAEFDAVLPQIAERFESDMADPAKWAMYQHAAVLNRLDECEAHNIPVRQFREEESKRRQEEAEQARQDEKRQNQERYDFRIDEIAKAIENVQEIRVGYNQYEYDGKNPVLDLFRLYDIALPLRTQGWVNTGLAAVTESGYSYYKNKRPSTVFGEYLFELRKAIKLTPIEQKRDCVSTALPDPAAKEANNTVENKLYDKFKKLFPEFMNGEYSTLQLEAEHAKPLSLEWVFGDRISISHNYELDGNPAYEPMVMLIVDSGNKTMTASSLELSEPPRNDVVYGENGQANTAMQQNINKLTSDWLDRIEKQGFIPVKATVEIDGEEAQITFDKDGKPVTQEPDKQYEIHYGHLGNGLTVYNILEEKDHDYVTVAHIDPDRVVTFRDKDLPDNLKARIELIARTSDARVSASQPEKHVFDTPPQPYLLEYHDITVYGVEVYNELKEQVANVLDNGRVEYTPGCYISEPALNEIEAFAKNRATEREAELLNYEGDAYGVYLFEPKLDDNRVVKDNYRLAWFGKMDAGETLDTIRARFSGKIFDVQTQQTQENEAISLPYEYIERANGVEFGTGDIIVIKQNGEITPWNVDMLAYSKRSDFYGNTELTVAKPETDKPKITELDLSLPDPTIGYSEMNLYGYMESDMYPLTKERAFELFDTDHPIYILFSDNTEMLVLEKDDIHSYGDSNLFGITHADWEMSPVRAAQLAVAANSEGSREADLLYGNENKFGIYQIRDGIDEARNFRFAPMRELNAYGLTVDRANYELVYTAPFSERIEFLTDRYPLLNRIYEDFNINQPADFTGHSLSVSDVIILKCNGDMSAHYIDSAGFVEIDNYVFFGEESQKTPISETPAHDNEMGKSNTFSQVGAKPDEYNKKSVTEMEADANTGKVISLTDLSKAINTERDNGKRQNDAPKFKKPTLMERLEEGKRRAAAQGGQKSLPALDSDKEVRT